MTIKRITRLAIIRCAVIAAAICLASNGIARANQIVTITIPDRAGEIPQTWLPYPGPPRANVLLPDNYNPHKRYPLLLMLSGLGGDYASNGVPATADGLGAIVVMPEGYDGWYSDWWNNGERGGPAWESYYLNAVIPTILARFPILPQRRYHAIAGISMGGLGATYLGGRLPGFFGSVASLSGFVDLQYEAPLVALGMGVIPAVQVRDDDPDLDPVDGPPNGFYLVGHNPASLAMNLRQTRVFESTGTGVPSSTGLNSGLGHLGAILVGTALEAPIIYPMNQLYHGALAAAGVNVTYQVHTGGHDSPDFTDEFDAMLAWNPFAPVVTNPASWTNDTVATSGQLWDIAYRFDQPPTQVVQFRRTGASLSISAAGSDATITTALGCVIHTATPATRTLPARTCKAASRSPKRRHTGQNPSHRRASHKGSHRRLAGHAKS
jgi:S-formylglutathione hydrolase FrmB